MHHNDAFQVILFEFPNFISKLATTSLTLLYASISQCGIYGTDNWPQPTNTAG